MTDPLESISEQLRQPAKAEKDASDPPLQLWHPQLSGDIDIVITADGQWIHEGRPILRQPLINLFASILRREDDGKYYLVTPVEKWRLRVEALPLLITDFDITDRGKRSQQLSVTTNTERRYEVGAKHPLYLPNLEQLEDVPAVKLPHGLSALFTRAAWYRLAEACDTEPGGIGVYSAGEFYRLG